MSLESRIRQLERSRSAKDDHHIHWMVPNPLGGVIAPDPKGCETCLTTDFKNRFIILYDMRPGKNQKELSHVPV